MDNFEQIGTEQTIVRKAEATDIPSILDLLESNLSHNLSPEEKQEGFVTWHPSGSELQEIINDSGIFLCLSDKELKGYAITMSREIGIKNEFFKEMLEFAEKMEFDGKQISEYRYVIFAQICINKKFRGGRTFHRLHTTTQSMLKDQNYEIFIGEIADANKKSLAVHSNYTDIGTYTASDGILWHVIIGNLKED